jgi:hypothetical protein
MVVQIFLKSHVLQSHYQILWPMGLAEVDWGTILATLTIDNEYAYMENDMIVARTTLEREATSHDCNSFLNSWKMGTLFWWICSGVRNVNDIW